MHAGPGARPMRLVPALLLIWLLALVLALVGLGNPPLRDWDEGIVARVSLEISQAPWSQKLLPTFWGEPYLNKPPAIHWLIAAVIGLWRAISPAPPQALPPEWVVRLGPAALSACLPPLLALVQLDSQQSALARQAFAEGVRQLRYDGGRVTYCDRHHYFSRWADAAQRQGWLSDITPKLPGARSRRLPLRFMGDHPDSYRPMKQAEIGRAHV